MNPELSLRRNLIYFVFSLLKQFLQLHLELQSFPD